MSFKTKIVRAILTISQQGLKTFLNKGLLGIFSMWFPNNPKEYIFAFKALHSHSQSKVMIDVGAATGVVLSPFAKSGWQVYAFEPDIKNRKILSQMFSNYHNVVIDPRAVSNEIRHNVKFYTSKVSPGISGLIPFDPSHVENGTVETTTLKSYIEENGITNVDILKVDTEGYDIYVLKGFPWKSIQPKVIICEFEDAKTLKLGYIWTDLASLLEDKGYKIILSEWEPIIQYGGHNRWRRFAQFPCKLLDSDAWGNLLASNDDVIFGDLIGQFAQFEKKRKFNY